jgi:hypothetical protein
MKSVLFGLMEAVENFIKINAPGALYGEWAKKEDCWNAIKEADFTIDLNNLKGDYSNPSSPKRKSITEDEQVKIEIQEEIERIKAIPSQIWNKIETWGNETGELSNYMAGIAFNMAGKVRNNSNITENDRKKAIEIIDKVIEHAPDLLFEIDEIEKQIKDNPEITPEVTVDLIKKIVDWDRKNKRLKDHHFRFMWNVAEGKHPLNDRAKKFALMNLKTLKKYGFDG